MQATGLALCCLITLVLLMVNAWGFFLEGAYHLGRGTSPPRATTQPGDYNKGYSQGFKGLDPIGNESELWFEGFEDGCEDLYWDDSLHVHRSAFQKTTGDAV